MSTACTSCGSPDWWRAAPGTARDARCFQYLADNVLEMPAVEEPLVAYCRGCDPLLVRAEAAA
jgi:hypothetical protein